MYFKTIYYDDYYKLYSIAYAKKKITPTQMTMLLFSRRALDASYLDRYLYQD